MKLIQHPLKTIATALREFRLDVKVGRHRYEVCRFPGQEIRLQSSTDPNTGHRYWWYGAWRVVIYNL